MLPRVGKGSSYRKAKMPKQSLEIWGYECSPFVKLAREVSADPPSVKRLVESTGATAMEAHGLCKFMPRAV